MNSNTFLSKTIIGFTALLSISACSEHVETQPKTVQQAQATTLTIAVQKMPEHYITSGSVASDHRVSISAQLSGYIKAMDVREGDKVAAGQLLVQIDPTDAKQAFIQASADAKDAESDLNRFQELLRASAVSSQQVDKAQLRFDVAKSNVARAKNQLNYANVRSPVDGVVVEKRLSVGDLASPGLPILSIEDPKSLLVATYVSDNYVSKIHEGDIVDIHISSLQANYEGIVRQVVQAADFVSHQFLVKIALTASPDIHPGMFAQANFRIGERDALMIPQQSIQSRSGLNAVYVVNSQSIAQYRLVRLGETEGFGGDASVEVVSGLHAGDTIAWAGTPQLKTGMHVTSSVGQ